MIQSNSNGVSIKINDTNPSTRYRPAKQHEIAAAVQADRSNATPKPK